jgi:hypothetical protein
MPPSSADFSLWGSIEAWQDFCVVGNILALSEISALCGLSILALAISLGMLTEPHRLKSVLLETFRES